jgi:hypothetical protein
VNTANFKIKRRESSKHKGIAFNVNKDVKQRVLINKSPDFGIISPATLIQQKEKRKEDGVTKPNQQIQDSEIIELAQPEISENSSVQKKRGKTEGDNLQPDKNNKQVIQGGFFDLMNQLPSKIDFGEKEEKTEKKSIRPQKDETGVKENLGKTEKETKDKIQLPLKDETEAKAEVTPETNKETSKKSEKKPGFFNKLGSGAKKVGSKIMSGVKSVGKGIGSAVKAIGKGIVKGVKKVWEWVSTIKDFVSWVKDGYDIFKGLFSKAKVGEEVGAEGEKVSAFSKILPAWLTGAIGKIVNIAGLITGPVSIIKGGFKIRKGIMNNNIIQGKQSKNEKEKAALEDMKGIQTQKKIYGSLDIVSGSLTFVEAIMDIAGVLSGGIGTIASWVFKIINWMIDGGKLGYKAYKMLSSKFKEKIREKNEITAEGMLSMKDTQLFDIIGFKDYKESGVKPKPTLTRGKKVDPLAEFLREGYKKTGRKNEVATETTEDKAIYEENKKGIIEKLNEQRNEE